MEDRDGNNLVEVYSIIGLFNCPFCGSEPLPPIPIKDQFGVVLINDKSCGTDGVPQYKIACTRCGIQTSKQFLKETAFDLWNQRTK